MKKELFFTVILLFTIHCSIFTASAQSWQELMDSTKAYQEKEDFPTALIWAKQALVKAEKEFGKDTNYASSLGNIANIFFYCQQIDSTVYYSEKQLQICRTVIQGDHPDLAQSIYNMGEIYSVFGNYKAAGLLFEEALEMRKRLFKGDHIDIASSLNSMAVFYSYQSNFNDAELLFKESFEMRKRLFKGDHPDLAESCLNLAYIYEAQGKAKEAEPLYIESLQMRRKLFRSDDLTLAHSIERLAMFYLKQGKYKEVEPLLKESLDMKKRLISGDHPDLANSIINMADFYFTLGNYIKVELLLNEALDIYRKLYKGDQLDLAYCIDFMARLKRLQGNFSEAESLFKEALEMCRSLFKTDNAQLSFTINNIAVFYFVIGNFSEAESFFKEALEMNRRLYKGDNPALAKSIDNLAGLYLRLDNYKKAELLCKEALEMNRRLFKDDHPDLAYSIEGMGILLRNQGSYKEAEPLFKESLEMNRRLYKTDHPDLASSIISMAYFFNGMGNYKEAEPLFKEALEMRRRLFKSDHFDLAQCINYMTYFLTGVGRNAEAEPLYDELNNITMKNVREYFPYLNESQKADYWRTLETRVSNYLDFGAKYCKTKPEIIEKMFDVTLATKGIVLNSTQKALSKARESRSNLDEWQSTRQLWMNLVQNPGKAKKSGYDVDSLERAAAELEKEISAQSSEFRKAFDSLLVRWRDVQNKLGTNEAAIEIIRNKSHKDSVKYLVLITKKDSKIPELVVMDNGTEMEEKYIRQFKDIQETDKKVLLKSDSTDSDDYELYDTFWKDIQSRLNGINKAYISLDGVYNQFNINTLLNPDTKKYVLDEIDLRLVTSTRDLVKDAKYATQTKPHIAGNAVLFGAPEFELKKEVAAIKMQDVGLSSTRNYYLGGLLNEIANRGITPLPGTRIEVSKITSSFKSKNIMAMDYLGEQALEENVKSVKNPRILHIATHGVFLKDVEYMTMDFQSDMKKHVENPLLRSMLLFSGAENTIKGETSDDITKDDGILTAFEVMNLDLDETELVVLSACNTGLGEIRNGEGVYGLQRAFKVAGAKSIVMSLWSVNDETTQLLMTKFYENWLNGMSKHEAFRSAQQYLKEKYPEPYYWGAFVMVGE